MSIPAKSHAQILSERMNLPAREAVVRHWRAEWMKYESRLRAREAPQENRDAGAVEFEARQRFGYLSRCTSDCVGDLVSCGMTREDAQLAAEAIGADVAHEQPKLFGVEAQ